MLDLDLHPSGRHFLQIPGPTNVPDRVLRAMSLPTIDHRGPEFGALGKEVLAGMKQGLQDAPSGRHLSRRRAPARGKRRSSTRCRPGDRVLMVETGHFAALWQKMAARLGLETEFHRPGSDPLLPQARLAPRRPAERSRRGCATTASTRSRRSASCTTRPRPASLSASPRCARRSTPPAIRRCCMVDTISRSPAPTTATTNGASTSPSAARRRA